MMEYEKVEYKVKQERPFAVRFTYQNRFDTERLELETRALNELIRHYVTDQIVPNGNETKIDEAFYRLPFGFQLERKQHQDRINGQDSTWVGITLMPMRLTEHTVVVPKLVLPTKKEKWHERLKKAWKYLWKGGEIKWPL
jgi:hypothetical protein